MLRGQYQISCAAAGYYSLKFSFTLVVVSATRGTAFAQEAGGSIQQHAVTYLPEA